MCVGEPIVVAVDARAAEVRARAQAEVQRLVGDARRLVDGEKPIPLAPGR